MSSVAKLPSQKRGGLLAAFADKFNIDPDVMVSTLKSTVFRQKEGQEVTDEQMTMLLIVASEYDLNPFTKEIYAFPDKGGIIPVVGVDGWSKIINSHPQYDGMEFNYSENLIELPGAKPCPEWMECTIYRKDRSRPLIVREYIDEVYRAPFTGNGKNGPYSVSGPWQTHTKRFLRHKAMIQAGRIAFSFSGIYDQDEADRILEKDAPASYSHEVVKNENPEPKGLPDYSQADFDKNFGMWQDLIEAGKKTAEQIIATVESKGALSDEMKMKIVELEH